MRAGTARTLAALMVALFTLSLAIVATGIGLRVGPRDSPSYLSSAESLAIGNGYTTPYGDPGKKVDFTSSTSPVVDFPPGYPVLLSAGVAMGIDSLDVARWVSVFVLSGIAFCLTFLARARGIGWIGSVVAGLIGGGLSFPWGLAPYSDVLYVLLLVGVLGLAGRAHAVGRMSPLWLATGLAIVASTVRTTGIALVGVVVVSAWIVARSLKEKMLTSALMGLAGILPFLLLTGEGTRIVVWHPPDGTSVKIFSNAVAGWITPPVGSPTFRVLVAATVLATGFAWVMSVRRTASGDLRLTFVWLPGLASAVGHLVILFLARALLDAQSNPSSRLIYPVAVSLLVAGVEVLPILRKGSRRSQRASLGLVLLAGMAAFAGAWTSTSAVLEVRGGGRGFAEPAFIDSGTVALLRTQVPSGDTFSNVPDGLWVAGYEGSRPTPVVVDPLSTRANPDMSHEMEQLKAKVESGSVIYFFRGQRLYLANLEDLRRVAPCEIMDDGAAVVLAGVDHALCER